MRSFHLIIVIRSNNSISRELSDYAVPICIRTCEYNKITLYAVVVDLIDREAALLAGRRRQHHSVYMGSINSFGFAIGALSL